MEENKKASKLKIIIDNTDIIRGWVKTLRAEIVELEIVLLGENKADEAVENVLGAGEFDDIIIHQRETLTFLKELENSLNRIREETDLNGRNENKTR